MRLVLCLLCAVWLTAADDLPPWVAQRPAEDGVLFGLGQAPVALDSAAAFARDLAFGDIAAQLNTEVEQSSELRKAVERVRRSGPEGLEEARDERTNTYRKSIATKTMIPFLPGAEVVEQVVSGERLYLLARLEKHRFATVVVNRLAEIDRFLAEVGAITASDPERVRRLRRAYAAAVERQTLVLLATAVDQVAAAPPITSDALAVRLGCLAEPLVFRLEGISESDALAEPVVAVADLLGAQLVPARGDAPFALRVRERFRDSLIDGWHNTVLTATVSVVHVPTGRTLGQFRERGEDASSTSKDEAHERARERIVQPLTAALEERLLTLLAAAPLEP